MVYHVVMTDITPLSTDIVFQHNAIGRGVHTLPMYLRRLVAVAMARIKWDEGMEVQFPIADALDALGMQKQTSTKQALRIASKDALRQTVEIDETATTGKWRGYSWFSFIELDEKTNTIKLKFNPDLRPYLVDFSTRFATFQLSDYGKLTGEYTQKLFDLSISFRGHAGQEGNKKNCWFFEYPVYKLRTVLNVTPEKYTKTNNLRVRVIDSSVTQINNADIGIRIECEYKYKGKTLDIVRFTCKTVSRLEPKNVSPATQTEDEDFKLIAKNQELFDAIKKDIADQPDLIYESRFGSREMQIEMEAVKELRKRLGKKEKGNK